MRKEVADIWCAALRSGEFSQGVGHLEQDSKACPLGVLALLAMTVGVCDFTPVKNKSAFDNEMGRLPISVVEWAEMYGQNGEIRGEFLNLTYYNDIAKYSFTDIADIIEDAYEQL